MAINQNHTVEELNGIKCAIVEKNATQQRVDFLKDLLTYNRFEVVIANTPPPKTAAAKPVVEGETTPTPLPPTPSTFTVGVTDFSFNSINAVYGRSLFTKDGHVVTAAYWQQKETISRDNVPYYENKN